MKNRNSFILTLLLFIVVSASYAQPKGQGMQGAPGMQNREPIGVVSGTIVEKNTGKAVEYANVVLFRAKDSSMVNGGVTNEKGLFMLTKVPFGKYYLVASFLGYANKRIPEVMVTPKATEVNLGKIELSGSSAQLGEVTISADRPTMEFNLDRKIINVEKNVATLGGTAVDVLENVPSVTVDENGGVSLRGDANVTLLIDGRPSGLTGTKLDQIPASSIETVEIITNPSARYNPEGMSGIINIKLKKKRESGFNGQLSLNMGTGDKVNSSVNLNYNVGKFNFFGSVDARSDIRRGWGNSKRTTIYDSTFTLINQKSDNRRKRNAAGYKLGVEYSFDSRNSLLLSWMKNSSDGKDHEFSRVSTFNAEDSLIGYYTLDNNGSETNASDDFVLNYRRTFPQKGRELTLDAVYNLATEDEVEDRDQLTDSSGVAAIFRQTNRSQTLGERKNLNVQLNYIHPFSEKMRLEAGYQGIYRSTDDDFRYFLYALNSQDWVLDDTTSNKFLYEEQIHALYATFGMTLEKYSFQLGGRLEQATSKGDQKTSGQQFTKEYFSFYPSVHITRKLPLDQEIQLSVSRRVNRPDMWSLNPFRDYSDWPVSVHYGNPNLSPEYINVYELGYSKYFKKSTFNTTLFYRDIQDVIKRYVFLDTNGVLNITSMNLSRGTSYGIEMILDHAMAKWWRISANFSYFRTKINGNNISNALTNDNYSWTSRMNNTFTLPGKWIIQLNAFYRGPMVNPQGTMKETYGSDLAFRKDFFKEKLTCSLRISDLFNTQRFRNESHGENFTGEMERKRESQVVFLGLTYKIGKNGKVKKQRRPDEEGQGREEDF